MKYNYIFVISSTQLVIRYNFYRFSLLIGKAIIIRLKVTNYCRAARQTSGIIHLGIIGSTLVLRTVPLGKKGM